MSEEGAVEGQEVVEQQEASTSKRKKTLSLGERIKVVDYLRSLVEPIVAESNAAVVAIVSDATKVELNWQHIKYMIDDPTMAEWKLGTKIHLKSLLASDDDRIAALEARVVQLEANVLKLAQIRTLEVVE